VRSGQEEGERERETGPHRADSYQIARAPSLLPARRRGLALTGGLGPLLAGALTLAGGAAAEAPPAAASRPAYRDLPFDEDWSALCDANALPSRDAFDPLKCVRLGDGAWASFGGQLRARLEVWSDYDFGGVSDPDESFGLSRVLAHADFHFSESVRFFIEGKSAGSTDPNVFDDTRPGDVDWLDLQNAFLELTNGQLRFRGGRQELGFARQRLVSPLDWANTRRTFDGATLEWLGADWHSTLFANRPVQVRPDDWNSYPAKTEAFYGLHATRRAEGTAPRLDLYAYGIEQEDGDDRFFTLGARASGPIPETRLDYDLELAGQLGSSSFRTFMLASQLGWWLSELRLSPRFFVGFDWASGGVHGVFDPLFPLGHAYLGAIDIIGRSNILAPSLGVSLRPLPAVTVELIAYQFWLDDPSEGLYAADGRLVRPGVLSNRHDVGTEIDLVGKWQLDPHTALFGGYAHFFPGAFVRDTGPDGATDFCYAMLQFTF
jgi:hypothetical protein